MQQKRIELVVQILLMISMVALLQIGWAAITPTIWEGNRSDLDIRAGGDHAAELWRRSKESEARDVREGGIGMGATTFVLAMTAIIIIRSTIVRDAKD